MRHFLTMSWMLITSTITIAAWGQSATRADLTAAFDSANSTYERGEFAVALKQYEGILASHRHFESEFNAGNAAFKLGELGRARLHYERAALLQPTHEQLEANLALLKSKVVDRITPIPQLGLSNWLSSWVGPGRVRGWVFWALFWWTAAWALWGWRWRKSSRDSRTTLAFFGAASLCLGLLGLWGALESNLRAQTPSQLVVLADRVDVLSTPSLGGTVLFQLHEGARACILDQTEGWAEIQLDNGNVGWIPTTATEDV